jgi:signal transduction histidine kinase
VRPSCCWPLLLLLCACAAEPPGGAPGVLRLGRAELRLDPAAAPPATGTGEPVSLPDRWRERRPDAGGAAWYRLELPRPAAPAGTWAVYLPHVNMSAAVWINGMPVGSAGRFAEPVANDFNRPLYFPFPAALLDRPVNALEIRLFAYPHHYGELDPVWAGPDEALRPFYEGAYRERVTLAEVATALCVAIVLFSSALWLGSGRDPVYGWLAVVTALWTLASLNYWLRDLPVGHWTWERIVHPALDGFMLALAVWAHRFAGVVRPRLERAFAAAAAISLGVAWIVPTSHLYPTVNVVHAAVFPAAVYATALILAHVRRLRPAEAVLYSASGIVALALAIHDLAMQFGDADPGTPFLLPYIVPLMLLSFGSTLVIRFASALRGVETLNRELEQRVVDKHRELEQSYEDRRALERAKLLAEERERLVRDMHDGLGGQLVSLLSLVEADGASDPRIAPAVRAALADMRLVIDSLDPALQTIGGALGAARARFEPLLSRSGVRLEWQASDLPRTPWLGPQDYLHVLRIVQEAIVNAVRHAGASRVAVRTGRRPDPSGSPGIFVEVCDDGRGFDPVEKMDAPGEKTSARGLRNMRERAARLAGTLRVEAAKRGEDGTPIGTRVELWLPASPAIPATSRPA